MLHKQLHSVRMLSAAVLLVNSICSDLHNFCVSGVNIGMTTMVSLARVSRLGRVCLLHRSGRDSDAVLHRNNYCLGA